MPTFTPLFSVRRLLTRTTRLLTLLVLACSIFGSAPVRADAGLLVLSALRLSYHPQLRVPMKRDKFGGPVAPQLSHGMQAMMERRFGSERAKKMTQGFSTTSGVVLRPMFWIPRAPVGGGMRGAMFALGGRF